MTYTITENPGFNSLEITFNEKPSAAIREALKALRFRWHKVKKLWYGYAKREAVEAALNSESGADTPDAAEIAPDEQPKTEQTAAERRELLERYREVLGRDCWPCDEHMTDYCTKNAAEIAQLPNGFLIAVEKQRIKTRFCFGYSDSAYNTDDFDRANDMAHHARTSEEYFITENMKAFRRQVENMNSDEYVMVLVTPYSGQPENSPLKSVRLLRRWDFRELAGITGTTTEYDDLNGTTIPLCECGRVFPAYIPTDEDKTIICETYRRAMDSHEKKIRQYLKRYGLTKVETWSYWRDR